MIHGLSYLRTEAGVSIAVITTVAAGMLLSTPALAQSGGGFDLTWNTIDGGGVMFATGGGFELGGTIGQCDAGPIALTGGGFKLIGGFWTPAALTCAAFAPADFDHDCDVDIYDYNAFEACASGPGVPLTAGCEGKDLDPDGDVDQADFAAFQRCFSGEDVPANPNCSQ